MGWHRSPEWRIQKLVPLLHTNKGLLDGWRDGWVDEWEDEWMAAWVSGWMEGWMEDRCYATL